VAPEDPGVVVGVLQVNTGLGSCALLGVLVPPPEPLDPPDVPPEPEPPVDEPLVLLVEVVVLVLDVELAADELPDASSHPDTAPATNSIPESVIHALIDESPNKKTPSPIFRSTPTYANKETAPVKG
jgi:hypothetical protein